MICKWTSQEAWGFNKLLQNYMKEELKMRDPKSSLPELEDIYPHYSADNLEEYDSRLDLKQPIISVIDRLTEKIQKKWEVCSLAKKKNEIVICSSAAEYLILCCFCRRAAR